MNDNCLSHGILTKGGKKVGVWVGRGAGGAGVGKNRRVNASMETGIIRISLNSALPVCYRVFNSLVWWKRFLR